MLQKVISDERGRVLLLVLIILCLGALLIPTFLSHTSTNLFATQATEKGMKEQYAADAGVENAIWSLLEGLEVPGEVSLDEFTINSKAVSVTIESEDAGWQVFKITSIASSDDESSTTIVSYVYAPLDYSWLFDYAITTPGYIDIGSNSTVTGTVRYNDEENSKIHGNIVGEVITDTIENWPTAGVLSGFYWEDVKDLKPYPYDYIDLKYTSSITPLRRYGDLDIKNTGDAITATLEGTVYVTGDLEFKQPGEQGAYTIDLNGQTIYVEGEIIFPANHVTISGSGCIIAVGNVTFQPGIDSSSEDFVFIMSVEGTSWIKPSHGTLYGSVAGDVLVDLQHADLTWTDPPEDGLNFPEEEPMRVLTYNINP